MSNKLVKKSNLGDLSYSDLGLDVSFQILEAPYLEDGTKMLFKIDDVENFCAYNLNDFADFGSILLLRQNDTFFFACIDKAKNDIAYINEKTHPQMYKEIGDIVFEMAMDTYGHYFSGIVVLVEVEPNTYKMIEFVVQMIPETVYYLTYTLSNRTFRVPLEESEIKQYPDLEVVDVGRITPVYGDITADMLSVQFVEKILLLIKNRNYTLIFENNTEQETEVKDELAAEPVSVE